MLNVLGASDSVIKKEWGVQLLKINQKGALNTEVSEMSSIYKKVLRKNPPANYGEVITGLREYFNNYTKVDPSTTKLTLGKSFSSINADALLSSSKKLLNVHRGDDTPDDRDSLIFKRLYSVEDLLLSHFEKQKPIITTKLARTVGLKNKVEEIIGSSTFGKPIKHFFTAGDLSATPPQTNPVTIVEAWRRTSPMGAGGIQSRHAITMETRDVQPTHLGYLDPLVTPESSRVGVTVGLASEVKKIKNDIATPVYTSKGTKK